MNRQAFDPQPTPTLTPLLALFPIGHLDHINVVRKDSLLLTDL